MEKIKRPMDKINEPNIPNNGKVITKRPNGTIRVQTLFNHEEEPSLTQQNFAQECDVNHIMTQFKKGQPITHVNTRTGVYGDFTEIPNYQEMLNTINQAQESFDELPSYIRGRFDNDPQKLVDWLRDDTNKEEAIKLGLRVKPEEKPEDPLLTEMKTLNKNIGKTQKKVAPPQDE